MQVVPPGPETVSAPGTAHAAAASPCRYIPVGLLEHLPQKINERPPYYVGRDYLETLMASQNVDDWIKIR